MTTHLTTDDIDTVVIGAGQCGLAAGYHLARAGRPFVILDSHRHVGDVWRERWHSLRLYTPARYDALPGLRFPVLDPHEAPSGRQMGDYLEAYAEHFALPVVTGTTVDRVERAADDRYAVIGGRRRWLANNVVIAVGGHSSPSIPAFAAQLEPGIRQMHSSQYRGPDQLTAGRVLVVGAAHSGADIALEAAQSGHPVVLSGRHPGELPFSIDGRLGRLLIPLQAVLWKYVVNLATPIGRGIAPKVRHHGGPLIRAKSADLDAAGIERVSARTAGVDGGRPILDDGRGLDVATVVWCTGFGPAFDWIDLPVFEADGRPRHRRGIVAEAPGLYFLGLVFQQSFSSMLVLGASRDAAYVVQHLDRRGLGTPPRRTAASAA